jgi:hypothetical protein
MPRQYLINGRIVTLSDFKKQLVKDNMKKHDLKKNDSGLKDIINESKKEVLKHGVIDLINVFEIIEEDNEDV